MPERMAAERPMWCDDFDMDLPKVIPGARDLIGDVGDVALWTWGSPHEGALNLPSCWNTDDGLTAYFGFNSPRSPEICWTRGEMIRCSFWEAVRDCWPHSYLMRVEGAPVFDSDATYREFERIMWDIRGWGGTSANRRRLAELRVRQALKSAASTMRSLVEAA